MSKRSNERSFLPFFVLEAGKVGGGYDDSESVRDVRKKRNITRASESGPDRRAGGRERERESEEVSIGR